MKQWYCCFKDSSIFRCQQLGQYALTLRLFPISHTVWADAIRAGGHVSESYNNRLPFFCPQCGTKETCREVYLCGIMSFQRLQFITGTHQDKHRLTHHSFSLTVDLHSNLTVNICNKMKVTFFFVNTALYFSVFFFPTARHRGTLKAPQH